MTDEQKKKANEIYHYCVNTDTIRRSEFFVLIEQILSTPSEENPICKWCGKYKRMMDGVIRPLCECPQEQILSTPSDNSKEEILARHHNESVQAIIYESDQDTWVGRSLDAMSEFATNQVAKATAEMEARIKELEERFTNYRQSHP